MTPDEKPTVPFPVANPDRDTDPPEGPVLNGELVPLEQNAAIDRRIAEARQSPNPVTRFRAQSAIGVLLLGERVQQSDRPAQAGKAIVRHSAYVVAGGGVVIRRWRDARSNNRYERMMTAAEAIGDWDRAADWESRAERARQARHQRRMDWLDAPMKLVKALSVGALTLVAVLLALGTVLAVASRDVTDVVTPLMALVNIVRWIVVAISVAWLPLLLAAPWAVVFYLDRLGQAKSGWQPPQWMASANAPRSDATEDPITPSKVVTALRDLGISELTKAIKRMDDAGAAMLSAIALAGCGVEVDATLPTGLTEAVTSRRRRLAENLDRHEHELFLSNPRPRTVRMWIADSGALDEPIGPSPLVLDEDLVADVYTGQAPWGEKLRGDPYSLSLRQRHLLITGSSNQGKTAALRALVLWLLHDTTVELHAADLKGIGDWHMLSGIATVLIEGPTDEHVVAATHMLEAGVAEMERRMAAVDPERYPDGVTRELARSGQGFHPLYLLVDEAQVAFMCPVKDDMGNPYGGKANNSRYFMAARKLHNQGRAVNVILAQGTQDPTDQNLPKLVREGAHIRGSLVVGTQEQAKMALGDKAVAAGASPHKLRQDVDKGTLVLAGGVPLESGESSVTVRTHFISGADATAVCERIKGRRRPVATNAAAEQPETRDLLADVLTVLGDEKRVKVVDVAARLRELAPTWTVYGQLDGVRLEALLANEGVQVPYRDGYKTVHADRVHSALVARDATAETEEPNQ